MRFEDHRMSTGTVGGYGAEFIAAHRQYNETPVALHVTVTVPMSLEDVTAALWWLVADWPRRDLDKVLTDTAFLHRMVLESVTGAGLDELEDARLGLAEIRPRTAAHKALARVRARVTELYGTATAPAPRGELVAGVA